MTIFDFRKKVRYCGSSNDLSFKSESEDQVFDIRVLSSGNSNFNCRINCVESKFPDASKGQFYEYTV